MQAEGGVLQFPDRAAAVIGAVAVVLSVTLGNAPKIERAVHHRIKAFNAASLQRDGGVDGRRTRDRTGASHPMRRASSSHRMGTRSPSCDKTTQRYGRSTGWESSPRLDLETHMAPTEVTPRKESHGPRMERGSRSSSPRTST